MHEQLGVQDKIGIKPLQMYRFLLHWDYRSAPNIPAEERHLPRLSYGVEYPDGCVHLHAPSHTFDTMLQLEKFFALRGKVRVEWIDVPNVEEQA